jgi:hypothetical protein
MNYIVELATSAGVETTIVVDANGPNDASARALAHRPDGVVKNVRQAGRRASVSLEIKTRGEPDAEGSERDWGEYRQRPRCYLFVSGESILDNLRNRRGRPHEELKPLVEQELRASGVSFADLQWSQRAGCECGCSPGWILYDARFENSDKFDVWATATI